MDKKRPGLPVFSSSLGTLPFLNSDWSFRFWVLLLVALLLLAALVVSVVSHWRQRSPRLGPTPDEELTQFREMYERGEITQEEFQRLKGVLGGKIRARMGKIPHPENEPSPPPSAEGPRSTDIRPE